MGGGGCWDRGPRLGVEGAGRRRFQEPLEAEPGALLWPSFPPASPWRTSEAILCFFEVTLSLSNLGRGSLMR